MSWMAARYSDKTYHENYSTKLSKDKTTRNRAPLHATDTNIYTVKANDFPGVYNPSSRPGPAANRNELLSAFGRSSSRLTTVFSCTPSRVSKSGDAAQHSVACVRTGKSELSTLTASSSLRSSAISTTAYFS